MEREGAGCIRSAHEQMARRQWIWKEGAVSLTSLHISHGILRNSIVLRVMCYVQSVEIIGKYIASDTVEQQI